MMAEYGFELRADMLRDNFCSFQLVRQRYSLSTEALSLLNVLFARFRNLTDSEERYMLCDKFRYETGQWMAVDDEDLDDYIFNCDTQSMRVVYSKDHPDVFMIVLRVGIDYAEAQYDDDGDLMNDGEYDDCEWIEYDVTEEVLKCCRTFNRTVRHSSAIVCRIV